MKHLTPIELRMVLDRLRGKCRSEPNREALYQASQWIEAQDQRNKKLARQGVHIDHYDETGAYVP